MATLNRVIRESREKVSATAFTARKAFSESSIAIKIFLLIKCLLSIPDKTDIKKRPCANHIHEIQSDVAKEYGTINKKKGSVATAG
jgi:hypothetical protein